jgi:hypothetical protein
VQRGRVTLNPHRYAAAKARGNYAGTRAYDDRQRARGTGHNPALRQLAGRIAGILPATAA